jgi:molecular chaperone DnaK (HSP70)
MAQKVFGIDLGTTYSCISHVDEYGRPEVLTNLDNEPTTPSVILFDSAEDFVVGKQAKRQARIKPEQIAALVKRHMGESDWRLTLHGQEWSAPALSSLVLRSLAADAARHTGAPVTDVVITVPAYFGDEERKNTKLAGEYAGLNVVDIINEPTAAAFAYGFANLSTEDRSVLVYDLGGGTFDTTVIRMASGPGGGGERDGSVISVVATDGDHELGGADWDDRLASHLSERFRAEAPGAEDPLDDSYGAQDLLTAAEEAKQTLSARESTDVLVIHDGQRASITVTRAEFEELTSSLLQRTVELTRAVLKAAEARGVARIDDVLLVGGSSKMPAVARRLREQFGFDPKLADPDLAVAKGAAIYGQKKELERVVIDDLVAQGKLAEGQAIGDAAPGDLDDVLRSAAEQYGMTAEAAGDIVRTEVQNVCSRGFGILLTRPSGGERAGAPDNEVYANFLTHRNDRLPLVVTDTFHTVVDDQDEVQLEVFEQGGSDESERVEDNNVLITGSITGIPPGYPRGTAVEITFSMGADGTLEVSARHIAKNEPLQLRVDTGAALSPDEVEAERQKVSLLKHKQ